MKKKLITAILTGAMLAAGMTTGVWADGEKTFVYGTTGYSEEMIGLPESHPESYHSFMAANLFDHIDCPKDGATSRA